MGWANYFCLGPVSTAYRSGGPPRPPAAPSVVVCQAQGTRAGDTARIPNEYLHEALGLVRLTERTRSFPWAKA